MVEVVSRLNKKQILKYKLKWALIYNLHYVIFETFIFYVKNNRDRSLKYDTCWYL